MVRCYLIVDGKRIEAFDEKERTVEEAVAYLDYLQQSWEGTRLDDASKERFHNDPNYYGLNQAVEIYRPASNILIIYNDFKEIVMFRFD